MNQTSEVFNARSQLNQLSLTLARLLDRGWDAYWVLSQPIYVLVRMMDALGVAAQKESPKKRNADGTGSHSYKVDPAARKARQAAKLKETNE